MKITVTIEDAHPAMEALAKQLDALVSLLLRAEAHTPTGDDD